jgi:hypothetical protein
MHKVYWSHYEMLEVNMIYQYCNAAAAAAEMSFMSDILPMP